jgi:DNA mismatch endonuclease, patch repair protein
MADIVTQQKRSSMMSGIHSRNTRPELVIRKELFNRGYRYRLHVISLPGKPDIVLKKYNAVILINGCFWHAHECNLFKWPKTNEDFWRGKISENRKRDEDNCAKLVVMGWRVLTIWECALKGKNKIPLQIIIDIVTSWLNSDNTQYEISQKN